MNALLIILLHSAVGVLRRWAAGLERRLQAAERSRLRSASTADHHRPARAELPGGPPAHWLALVQQAAPELLDSAEVQSSDVDFGQEPATPDEDPAPRRPSGTWQSLLPWPRHTPRARRRLLAVRQQPQERVAKANDETDRGEVPAVGESAGPDAQADPSSRPGAWLVAASRTQSAAPQPGAMRSEDVEAPRGPAEKRSVASEKPTGPGPAVGSVSGRKADLELRERWSGPGSGSTMPTGRSASERRPLAQLEEVSAAPTDPARMPPDMLDAALTADGRMAVPRAMPTNGPGSQVQDRWPMLESSPSRGRDQSEFAAMLLLEAPGTPSSSAQHWPQLLDAAPPPLDTWTQLERELERRQRIDLEQKGL